MNNIQESLQSLLKEWQQILRLQDWDINLELVPAKKTDSFEWGQCKWNFAERVAKIQILDPDHSREDSIIPFDIESTLVHELIHVTFAPLEALCELDFRPNSPQLLLFEQLINQLTRALVEAKKQGRRQEKLDSFYQALPNFGVAESYVNHLRNAIKIGREPHEQDDHLSNNTINPDSLIGEEIFDLKDGLVFKVESYHPINNDFYKIHVSGDPDFYCKISDLILKVGRQEAFIVTDYPQPIKDALASTSTFTQSDETPNYQTQG
jgi:hypothetical protein